MHFDAQNWSHLGGAHGGAQQIFGGACAPPGPPWRCHWWHLPTSFNPLLGICTVDFSKTMDAMVTMDVVFTHQFYSIVGNLHSWIFKKKCKCPGAFPGGWSLLDWLNCALINAPLRWPTCDLIFKLKTRLCDMRLLHAVTGKLNDFNFLTTTCNSRISHKQAHLHSAILLHVACRTFLLHRVNARL